MGQPGATVSTQEVENETFDFTVKLTGLTKEEHAALTHDFEEDPNIQKDENGVFLIDTARVSPTSNAGLETMLAAMHDDDSEG